MGMFDSLYDASSEEWQTKAFDCVLAGYRVGDEMPFIGTDTYQAEVLGGKKSQFINSYATIRSNRLASLPDERDEDLPLLDYHGDWIVKEEA
jgi:hypothetical protein